MHISLLCDAKQNMAVMCLPNLQSEHIQIMKSENAINYEIANTIETENKDRIYQNVCLFAKFSLNFYSEMVNWKNRIYY